MVTSVDIATELRNVLLNEGDGSTRIEDLELRQIQDIEGLHAWRVVLYLTPPPSGQWDVALTRKLKQSAREATDRLLWESGIEADGVTSVSVTAKQDETPEKDLAPADEPANGELSDVELESDSE